MFSIVIACGLASCARDEPAAVREGSARLVLKPLVISQAAEWRRRTAYVPVYSSIHWGFDRKLVDLSITVTLRNTSTERDLAVHSVRYYDSTGKLIRSFVDTPSSLSPMTTADFVIQQRDTTGGVGASFRIETGSSGEADDALIEAVMIGQNGNAGVSFTSQAKDLEPQVKQAK
ncbi:MAG: DUF3124 domain-containing protein [Bryobacteraceae bacterium]